LAETEGFLFSIVGADEIPNAVFIQQSIGGDLVKLRVVFAILFIAE
jgi:hypothetical protein